MAAEQLPESTDVAVLGAGPGGYAAAFKAAELGLDVTLISAEPRLGGVCLNRGCIPSKALLHLTELSHAAEAAASMGVRFGQPEIDLDGVRDWKDRVVRGLTDGLANLCRQRGVRVVQGRGSFDGPQSLRVEGGGTDAGRCSFGHAIVATGSHPIPLPGVDFAASRRIMSSTGALELADVPEDLLVVGAGYIGMELGMVYATLGSRVTIADEANRLMPEADADLCEPLARAAERRFQAVHVATPVSDLQESERRVEVSLGRGNDATARHFDRVLIAVGRAPSTSELDLASADVATDDHGFVQVDGRGRTTNERVYAIGDAAGGGMMLAHEAMMVGKITARCIAGQDAAYDARAVPAVVYTDPQLAWCGLTEVQAGQRGLRPRIVRYPWSASGRAASMGVTDGMTKLVLEPDSGRVLGMGIVGPQAEAMIAEGVLAVEMGAVAEDLAGMIHPHPTLTETVGEGAELFFGHGTHYG